MADPPNAPGAEPPPMPRWVKVGGLVLAAIIVLLIAIAVFGGSEHGPGRHLPGGKGGNVHTAPEQQGS